MTVRAQLPRNSALALELLAQCGMISGASSRYRSSFSTERPERYFRDHLDSLIPLAALNLYGIVCVYTT